LTEKRSPVTNVGWREEKAADVYFGEPLRENTADFGRVLKLEYKAAYAWFRFG